MEDLVAQLCAMACCLGGYGLLAGGASWLLHRRTLRVEEELGRRAVPPDEKPLLIYAGASVVWLSAAILAAVGLFRREWTRVGRNCAFILFGHLGLATVAGTLVPVARDARGGEPLAIVAMACAIVLGSAAASVVFLWLWGARRLARLEALPPTGDPPSTVERVAVYLASFLVGLAGPIAAAIYRHPQNVRVGVTALRVSLVNLSLIVLAVCLGIPALVYLYGT